MPKEYQDLDVSVYFINYKLESLKYINLKNYIFNIPSIFLNKINGTSCNYYNKVFIYECNFDFKWEFNDIERLRMIHALYHEIRHQWQRENKQQFCDLYNIPMDYKEPKNTPYEDKIREVDARKVSSELMNNNIHKIRKILEV